MEARQPEYKADTQSRQDDDDIIITDPSHPFRRITMRRNGNRNVPARQINAEGNEVQQINAEGDEVQQINAEGDEIQQINAEGDEVQQVNADGEGRMEEEQQINAEQQNNRIIVTYLPIGALRENAERQNNERMKSNPRLPFKLCKNCDVHLPSSSKMMIPPNISSQRNISEATNQARNNPIRDPNIVNPFINPINRSYSNRLSHSISDLSPPPGRQSRSFQLNSGSRNIYSLFNQHPQNQNLAQNSQDNLKAQENIQNFQTQFQNPINIINPRINPQIQNSNVIQNSDLQLLNQQNFVQNSNAIRNSNLLSNHRQNFQVQNSNQLQNSGLQLSQNFQMQNSNQLQNSDLQLSRQNLQVQNSNQLQNSQEISGRIRNHLASRIFPFHYQVDEERIRIDIAVDSVARLIYIGILAAVLIHYSMVNGFSGSILDVVIVVVVMLMGQYSFI